MKVLITTSTLPAHDKDPVPAFVRDQAINLKKMHPDMNIILHAPHNFYSQTKNIVKNIYYDEERFHYFFPYRFELLAGRGILPVLKKYPVLYIQVPFFFVFHFFSLLRSVRRNKPDLIYAHWFTPQAISASLVSRLTGVAFIFTSHASDVSVLKPIPFTERIIKNVCQRATYFTSVSERTMQKLESSLKPRDWKKLQKKHSIIPMGVDSKFSPSKNQEVLSLTKEYGLTKESFVILFIGRLAEKKGVEYLIEAISLLPESLPHVHLVIAGDGQLIGSLRDLSEELSVADRVTFTGYVLGDKKNALLTRANAVCIPSIIDDQGDSEGLPVVLMEALAAHKVVIASTSSGAEGILKDRQSGFLVPEKSASALAEAIVHVTKLSSNTIKSIEKECVIVAEQFNWDTINTQYYSLFLQATHEI